jgi:hypothetical protein
MCFLFFCLKITKRTTYASFLSLLSQKAQNTHQNAPCFLSLLTNKQHFQVTPHMDSLFLPRERSNTPIEGDMFSLFCLKALKTLINPTYVLCLSLCSRPIKIRSPTRIWSSFLVAQSRRAPSYISSINRISRCGVFLWFVQKRNVKHMTHVDFFVSLV